MSVIELASEGLKFLNSSSKSNRCELSPVALGLALRPFSPVALSLTLRPSPVLLGLTLWPSPVLLGLALSTPLEVTESKMERACKQQ